MEEGGDTGSLDRTGTWGHEGRRRHRKLGWDRNRRTWRKEETQEVGIGQEQEDMDKRGDTGSLDRTGTGGHGGRRRHRKLGWDRNRRICQKEETQDFWMGRKMVDPTFLIIISGLCKKQLFVLGLFFGHRFEIWKYMIKNKTKNYTLFANEFWFQISPRNNFYTFHNATSIQWWENIIKWTRTNIQIYLDATLYTKQISEYIRMQHIYRKNIQIYSYSRNITNTNNIWGSIFRIFKYLYLSLIEEIF